MCNKEYRPLVVYTTIYITLISTTLQFHFIPHTCYRLFFYLFYAFVAFHVYNELYTNTHTTHQSTIHTHTNRVNRN